MGTWAQGRRRVAGRGAARGEGGPECRGWRPRGPPGDSSPGLPPGAEQRGGEARGSSPPASAPRPGLLHAALANFVTTSPELARAARGAEAGAGTVAPGGRRRPPLGRSPRGRGGGATRGPGRPPRTKRGSAAGVRAGLGRGVRGDAGRRLGRGGGRGVGGGAQGDFPRAPSLPGSPAGSGEDRGARAPAPTCGHLRAPLPQPCPRGPPLAPSQPRGLVSGRESRTHHGPRPGENRPHSLVAGTFFLFV